MRQKYVYFLLFRNILKVGCSIDPEWRVRHFRYVTGTNWKILGYFPGSHEEERSFHRFLRTIYPSVEMEREMFKVGYRFSLDVLLDRHQQEKKKAA